MHTQAYIRMLATRNLVLTFFIPFFIYFSSKCKSNILFSYFCKLCPRSQVGEAPIAWRHDIGSLLRKQGPFFVR